MLSIKAISFSDDVPMSPHLEHAPWRDLTSPSHVTFAVTVDDGGSGLDFWGRAVLGEQTTTGDELASGWVSVASLDHEAIKVAIRGQLARFDSWIRLRSEGPLVFEDGE